MNTRLFFPLGSGGFLFLTLLLYSSALLIAGDWPQYRGANHDGISSETIRTNWSQEAPRQLWKVPLNPGLSSLSISGGRVFTMVQRRGEETESWEHCVALDADTGRELWASVPLDLAYYPYGGVGSDDGPRSTPSVVGDRVYVLTSYLRLFCLNVTNGQTIWSRNLKIDYGGEVIPWENAASPLIDGDLIFINCNGPNQRLLALRTQDGSEAWKGHNDRMTQATPIAATIAGVRQVIFFAQSGLVSVVPGTGVVLWRYPFSYSTSTAASPVVGEDIVYCSAAYGTGAGAVRISNVGGGLTTNQLWRTPGAKMNHWATPVYHNGHLYGIYGQSFPRLECIELATGTQKWPQSQSGFGYGSTLMVNGQILALSESGALVLVEATPSGYIEIGRYQALDGSHSSLPGNPGKCWNAPAISNGRIYVRSTTEAVALDVSIPPPALLKLQPALTFTDGVFHLFLSNTNGAPLDSNRLGRIEVFATTNLLAGSNGWTRLTNSLVLSNGQARLSDPGIENRLWRFYRTEERP